MTPLTPAERSLRARLGGLAVHARHDSRAIADRARAGMDKRFYDEVDPDRVLPEKERDRRAGLAKRAYFTRLSLKAAQARRRRREADEELAAAEAALSGLVDDGGPADAA